MKWWVILIIVAAIVAAVIAILTILGKRAQKKQEAQREQIEAAKQTVNMLIIDKKKMKLKDAGLPQMVLDNTNKLMQRSKVPVVKAKVGPRIMTFLTDNDVYDVILHRLCQGNPRITGIGKSRKEEKETEQFHRAGTSQRPRRIIILRSFFHAVIYHN